MIVNVDTLGKACPLPVVMAKNALDSIKEGKVCVVVDNEIACENVKRLVESMGLDFYVERKDSTIEITINKLETTGDTSEETKKPVVDELHDKYVVLISGETLGRGSSELGKLLLNNYIQTLEQAPKLPTAILFVNSGVYLTTKGTVLSDPLKQLESLGVEVLSCGTCLDYYNIKDMLQVGKTTNMYEMVEKTTTYRTISL